MTVLTWQGLGWGTNAECIVWSPPPFVTGTTSAICPDLLRFEQIGEADNMRGRVVRGFFWLMRIWPV